MRPAKLTVIPDLESLECPLPPRSVLYRIPPLGMGTGQAEGLLSYLVRLAAAHSVNPRRLVREVFAADDPEFAKLYSAGFFIRHAGTINGLGKYAELFLKEIAKLTTADFLRPMTLLPLQALLPPNGQGLLTRHPRWCPSCLQEMVKSGDAYRPLTWSCELYRVCLRHGVSMADVCPHCGKTQPFIARYPDLARCDHCGRVLWNGRLNRKRVSVADRWIAEALEDLVGVHFAELDGRVTSENWREFTRLQVARFARGNRAALCRSLGLRRWVLTGWLTKGEDPSMPQLLSICYCLDAKPTAILLASYEQSPQVEERNWRRSNGAPFKRKSRSILTPVRRKELACRVNKLANGLNACGSLAAVAKSLGLNRSTLTYWFPAACRRIVERHQCAQKQLMTGRVSRDRQVLLDIVRNIEARGAYPSRHKVNGELRKIGLSLARPDLLAIYRNCVVSAPRGK